eukprot:scaffold197823_cov24-Prasinocladus_malaysianus.AAC.2
MSYWCHESPMVSTRGLRGCGDMSSHATRRCIARGPSFPRKPSAPAAAAAAHPGSIWVVGVEKLCADFLEPASKLLHPSQLLAYAKSLRYRKVRYSERDHWFRWLKAENKQN